MFRSSCELTSSHFMCLIEVSQDLHKVIRGSLPPSGLAPFCTLSASHCFPRTGHLWQLDGRRKGPVCHKSGTTPERLLDDAADVVKRFAEVTNSISFNLIALSAPQSD